MKDLHTWLYYGLDLKTAGIVLGVVLVLGHLFAMLKADSVMDWLKKLPRDRVLGIVILAVDFVWALMLLNAMDLGEFYHYRKAFLILVTIGFVLVVLFVEEFLAVRALGILLLLLATPLLEAAFLEEPISRLLLPTLAYLWIILGLFWVGMPFLLRDQINWLSQSPKRWKMACLAGAGYGLAVLACAALFYPG